MATVIIDARYLNRPGTGINSYLRSAIEDLLDEGHDLILLTDRTVDQSSYDHSRVRLVMLRGSYRLYWEQGLLPHFLKSVDYDIYFAPANMGLPIFYRKKGHKFVLTVHDLIPTHYLRQYWRRPRYILYYLFSTTASIFRADEILADSSFTAWDVKRKFRRDSTVAYVPSRIFKAEIQERTSTGCRSSESLGDRFFIY